ncbi:7-cyano-7-deazaguanine synthase [Actinokineospora alba]|uniref:7-cyano-7-deazaguanine synthase n=1 Tax=Actinokineospora alba TaxID=504798 RepID=A0A1H0LAB0_9PSEU|nr:7-cyano-7-deazaguanine synthase QueC [Actinokineospora alba]TDP67253.1 7-cyano-7-deazaguanine synthase [Actinokineospora alba]SDJ02612.1 7-cyano-7-deazaguanine synthase [Actinokineospora alba]SDO65184.1 7-cyano-7-deazaguanine synthase [Actinokineospora alba]
MRIDRPEHRHPDHTVVIASGGLDSTVLAYWLAARQSRLTLVSFDYGQRNRVELDHAAEIARLLDSPHRTIDLTNLGAMLTGSALTDASVAVPDGHYTVESMAAAVVPNHNAIMLYIAVEVAIAVGADAVAFGARAGNYAIYPDCRPEFGQRFARSVQTANEGLLVPGFQVLAPFLTLTKTDIVRVGEALAVPFARTWSCHLGHELHCGTCEWCTERQEAFRDNGLTDPTLYRGRVEGELTVMDKKPAVSGPERGGLSSGHSSRVSSGERGVGTSVLSGWVWL